METKYKVENLQYSDLLKMVKNSLGKTNVGNKSSEDGDISFTGTSTIKQALELAENGWDEGTKKIKDVLDNIQAIGKATTFSPVYQVSGESVDVGRYLTGEPENMLEWELVETTGHKVVDLYFNIMSAGGVSSIELMNYGAVGLSVVDYLESIGVRVNLYVIYTVKVRQGDTAFVVKVKSANESLNLPVVAFAMCHPSMQRRMIFKWQEMNRDLFDFGHGRCINPRKEDFISNDVDAILFQSINNLYGFNFRTEEDTKKYLIKFLPQVLNELKITDLTDAELMQSIKDKK